MRRFILVVIGFIFSLAVFAEEASMSVKPSPFSHYGNRESYQVNGIDYHLMMSAVDYHQKGIASWYGEDFHKKRTSSGEQYDMYAMTAAHKTLPLPTFLRVKNLENGREIVVKVNDRGPFHDKRIIDLSYAAAKRLGMMRQGTARVEIKAIQDPKPAKYYLQAAAYTDLEHAKALIATLKTQFGLASVVKKPNNYFVVRCGPFKIKERASKALAVLRAMGLPGVFIVLG